MGIAESKVAHLIDDENAFARDETLEKAGNIFEFKEEANPNILNENIPTIDPVKQECVNENLESNNYIASPVGDPSVTDSSLTDKSDNYKDSHLDESDKLDLMIHKILQLRKDARKSTNIADDNKPRRKSSLIRQFGGYSFPLSTKEVQWLCLKIRENFLNEPTLLKLDAPINIVGDIHGQFEDLLRILDVCGHPSTSKYLFLGDYVDRGKQSLESICLLFCYKLKYPGQIYLLRGNHECANINRVYGFFDECKRKLNVKNWRNFTDVFNCLPIAAIVAEKIFCVHGGLSPHLKKPELINQIRRPTDVPGYGILNDLLWSDPSEQILGWEDNDRGVSYIFGPDIVSKFLEENDLDVICRAHMVVENGYEFFGTERNLITVFSAPNYCGEFDNCAAIMSVNSELVCSFQILEPVFHKI